MSHDGSRRHHLPQTPACPKRHIRPPVSQPYSHSAGTVSITDRHCARVTSVRHTYSGATSASCSCSSSISLLPCLRQFPRERGPLRRRTPHAKFPTRHQHQLRSVLHQLRRANNPLHLRPPHHPLPARQPRQPHGPDQQQPRQPAGRPPGQRRPGRQRPPRWGGSRPALVLNAISCEHTSRPSLSSLTRSSARSSARAPGRPSLRLRTAKQRGLWSRLRRVGPACE